ncbi:hypothetical protein [Endozoicomonas sp. ONNA2]|uniref:hypothetical protein n=1 Tax=Endozoicomonas sp. ONNA2 TaxID=2828741 RepID=UPI0021494C37|nr:hypothetical protein [Endozoicomonas sp. ONNA2]
MHFYFTFGTGHIGFPGYVKVTAPNANKARETMIKYYGQKWLCQYSSLRLVPDRSCHLQDTLVWPE